MTGAAPHLVAIVGGGFTGAALAYHLARAVPEGVAEICVIEPRETIGSGLAYSSTDEAHRVNVPAARMYLDPDDPGDFACWLETEGVLDADPDCRAPGGRLFPHRHRFGAYMGARLAPYLRVGRIRHLRGRVTRAGPIGIGFELALADGSRLRAGTLVIATSHPPPSPPSELALLSAHPRFIADPTRPDALRAVSSHHRVLIVGTGLTMADAVATLKRQGHHGHITAISRRGLLSRGHPEREFARFGDFTVSPNRTVRELLRAVRSTVAEAERLGMSWHPVFDTLRHQGADIWLALPGAERRRLVRHLRPYWDVHRFRVAPQVDAVIAAARAEGSLEIVAGSLQRAELVGDRIAIEYRQRRCHDISRREFDAVVLTTGPGHRRILETVPFLRNLAIQGLVRLDRVGLGLDVDRQYRAIGATGAGFDRLLVAGPLARGTFGELMGLPEVARHAREIAHHIADRLLTTDSEINLPEMRLRAGARPA